MKQLLTSLYIGSAALMFAGCGDKGSAEQVPAPAPLFAMSSNFNPTQSPANQAPEAYTNQIIKILSSYAAEVPTSLVFKKDGAVRTRAYQRLSADGRKALAEIQKNCEIDTDISTATGALAVGSTQVVTTYSGAKGPRCPINLSRTYTESINLLVNNPTEAFATSEISSANTYQQQNLGRRGFNPEPVDSRRSLPGKKNYHQQNSGFQGIDSEIVSFKVSLTGKKTFSQIHTGDQLTKEKIQTSGQITMTLKDGTVLSGPIYVESLLVTKNTPRGKVSLENQEQTLVEFSSPQGMIRIVYIKDSETREIRQAYVNGKDVNPFLLASFFNDEEIYERMKQR